MKTGISKANCDIIFANESGYCNHIMALLFEIADCSLHQLISIPSEKASISMTQRWGVPAANFTAKKPIMTL